jgi:hypothetical protein
MHDTLRQCEREVERARSKLASDLAELRAPQTFSSFTDDLKRDALETKDALVDQVKETAQSKFADLIEDVKARAAANPAATLAIGAGIAWRLLRHPPIATALIAAGIYSLWRTNGYQPPSGASPDYVQHGKERLMEQAGDLASGVAARTRELAADAGEAVSAKTTEMIEAAKAKAQEWSETAEGRAQQWSEAAQGKAQQWSDAARGKTQQWSGAAQTTAQQWSDGIGQSAAAVGSALKAETESLNAAARRTARDATDKALGATRTASAHTAQVVREAMHDGRDALANADSRDKLLLGVAGIAVAAALGIACQRRIAEEVD